MYVSSGQRMHSLVWLTHECESIFSSRWNFNPVQITCGYHSNSMRITPTNYQDITPKRWNIPKWHTQAIELGTAKRTKRQSKLSSWKNLTHTQSGETERERERERGEESEERQQKEN